MSKITRFLLVGAWMAAALCTLPAFLPNGYNYSLFLGRIVVSLVLLSIAYFAFRNARAANRTQIVGAALALCAGVFINYKGFGLIKPDNARILSIVEAGLQQKGVAAAYRDLTVSDTKCYEDRKEWDCLYKISYTAAANGKSFQNEQQSGIALSKASGEITGAYASCEYDFQWSQRLRASPYYVKEAEPIEWFGCNRSTRQGYFANAVREKYGIVLLVAENEKPGQTLLGLPERYYAERLVKELYPGEVQEVSCVDAKNNPRATSVNCEVSGEKVVWQDNSLAAVGLGAELKGNFRTNISIVPERHVWVLK